MKLLMTKIDKIQREGSGHVNCLHSGIYLHCPLFFVIKFPLDFSYNFLKMQLAKIFVLKYA